MLILHPPDNFFLGRPCYYCACIGPSLDYACLSFHCVLTKHPQVELKSTTESSPVNSVLPGASKEMLTAIPKVLLELPSSGRAHHEQLTKQRVRSVVNNPSNNTQFAAKTVSVEILFNKAKKF